MLGVLLLLLAANDELSIDGMCRAPLEVLGEEELAGSRALWFGQMLAAMNEHPIEQHRGDARAVVRFLWLRSFHDPVVLRVRIGENGANDEVAVKIGHSQTLEAIDAELGSCVDTKTRNELYQAYFATMREWQPLTLRRDDATPLPHRSRPLLLEALEDSGLETGNVNHLRPGGRDGAMWFFEYSDADAKTFAAVWSPRRGALRELGELMLELGDVRVDAADLY